MRIADDSHQDEYRLLTASALAEVLGVTGADVMKMVAAGTIPFSYLTGRGYRFQLPHVTKALARSSVTVATKGICPNGQTR